MAKPWKSLASASAPLRPAGAGKRRLAETAAPVELPEPVPEPEAIVAVAEPPWEERAPRVAESFAPLGEVWEEE